MGEGKLIIWRKHDIPVTIPMHKQYLQRPASRFCHALHFPYVPKKKSLLLLLVDSRKNIDLVRNITLVM